DGTDLFVDALPVAGHGHYRGAVDGAKAAFADGLAHQIAVGRDGDFDQSALRILVLQTEGARTGRLQAADAVELYYRLGDAGEDQMIVRLQPLAGAYGWDQAAAALDLDQEQPLQVTQPRALYGLADQRAIAFDHHLDGVLARVFERGTWGGAVRQ